MCFIITSLAFYQIGPVLLLSDSDCWRMVLSLWYEKKCYEIEQSCGPFSLIKSNKSDKLHRKLNRLYQITTANMFSLVTMLKYILHQIRSALLQLLSDYFQREEWVTVLELCGIISSGLCDALFSVLSCYGGNLGASSHHLFLSAYISTYSKTVMLLWVTIICNGLFPNMRRKLFSYLLL